MLVLSRKVQEEIVIGDGIRIKVIDVQGNRVRLGIEAPHDIPVHRAEVSARINLEAQAEVSAGNSFNI
jgi:carbon storage regulator